MLTDPMIRYVLMQRTEYRSGWHQKFKSQLKKLGVPFSFDTALLWSERFAKRRIGKLYYQSMEREFSKIRRFVPATAKSVLDIGAGLGGFDAILYQEMGPALDLYILDKSGESEKVYYGYAEEGAHYNQLYLTKEFLLMNGVPETRLFVNDVDKDGYPLHQKFDVIISLKSWGFHYAVETYIKDVLETLDSDGVLILDIRKDTEGEIIFSKYFRIVDRIESDARRARIVARRQG